jgi:phosphoribosylformylglycinamidine cyclo-ligase
VPDDDWRRSFNLGLGMIFAIGRKDAAEAEKLLRKIGETAYRVGKVVDAPEDGTRVVYR